MPPTVPTSEPKAVTAGSSWRWDRAVADYPPSDGWTLKYAIRGQSVLDIDASAAAAGDYYEVRVTPAATAELVPGTYQLLAFVENGTDTIDLQRRTLVVHPNLRTFAEGEGQSENEKVLALIQAQIAGRLPADRENFQVNGMAITRIPIDQLVRLQRTYEMRVLFERSPNARVSREVVFR